MDKYETRKALQIWIDAWNAHDLESVMAPLHDDVVFENWDGSHVKGRRGLRRAWADWFDNHGDFRFIIEELFIDEDAGKALLMWTIEWPSKEKAFEGEWEKRRALDVLHFNEGKIILKTTYTKTALEIGGKKVKLKAGK